MLDTSKTVSIDRLIELAARLHCEPGADNPEYDRALVNLVSDAAGLGEEEQPLTADLIKNRNKQIFGHKGKTSVRPAFVTAELDGLNCYAVLQYGRILGYVRMGERGRWGATQAEYLEFVYDFDTRLDAAQSLGAI